MSEQSRFYLWLVEYCEGHKTTLARLAREAGMSSSALLAYKGRSDKKPSIETLMKLSAVTGKDLRFLTELSGLPVPDKIAAVNPMRIKIIEIFDELPPALQSGLVEVARAFQRLADTQKDE